MLCPRGMPPRPPTLRTQGTPTSILGVLVQAAQCSMWEHRATQSLSLRVQTQATSRLSDQQARVAGRRAAPSAIWVAERNLQLVGASHSSWREKWSAALCGGTASVHPPPANRLGEKTP